MKCVVLCFNCFTAEKFKKSLKNFIIGMTPNCFRTDYWHLWWSFLQNTSRLLRVNCFRKTALSSILYKFMDTVLKHWFHRPMAKRTDLSDMQVLARIYLKLLRWRNNDNQKIFLNLSNHLQRTKLNKF